MISPQTEAHIAFTACGPIPQLDAILAALPRCRSIVVAGGAAVDYATCGDIDVWIGANRRDIAEEFIKTRLERGELRKDDLSAEYAPMKSTLIGAGYFPGEAKVVQVLIYEGSAPTELMDEFDLSICRWAYREGRRTAGAKATLPTETIQQVKKSSDTIARADKYCTRFGLSCEYLPTSKGFWNAWWKESAEAIQGAYGIHLYSDPLEPQTVTMAPAKSLTDVAKKYGYYVTPTTLTGSAKPPKYSSGVMYQLGQMQAGLDPLKAKMDEGLDEADKILKKSLYTPEK